jgi:glycerol uptake facilitator-like aquaporin
LFVFIGCGSAMAMANVEGSAWLFQVSLTFGLAITALAYSICHLSGGQINCAVTFGLFVAGRISVTQAIVNTLFQLLGAVFGSMITAIVFSDKMDKTGGLGTNAVSPGFSPFQALVAEIMGTFVLVFVVLETAVAPGNSPNRIMACMAIGLAVFLAHSVMIPIDGCSINPTRSFWKATIFTSPDVPRIAIGLRPQHHTRSQFQTLGEINPLQLKSLRRKL